ncbi:MAG: O-antigen ligase family protein [Thermodesulfobacteriota bacterium]
MNSREGEWSTAANRLIYFLACSALFAMPLGTSPFTILGVCLLALWVFSGQFLSGYRFYLQAPWFLPVLGMTVLVWLGLIWSCEPWGLGLEYAEKSHYWLYALPVASVSPMITRKDHLIMAFLAGLFANSLAGFFQLGSVLLGFSRWGGRVLSGFCSGYSTLGILLVLGIMAASFYFGKAGEWRRKALFGFLMLTYFGHLMILQGRGAYLTFLLLSPMVFHNVLRGRRTSLVFLSCLLAAGVLFSSPIVQNRISRIGMDLQHHLRSDPEERWGRKYSEHQDRFYMWRWAGSLFLDHPLLGVGTGGYRRAILARGGEVAVNHPHSNLLYVASSFGMIGLVVFGWLFWILLRTGWRNRDQAMGFFVLASSLVLLLGGITDTHILDSGGAFLLSMTTGLSSSLHGPFPGGGEGR